MFLVKGLRLIVPLTMLLAVLLVHQAWPSGAAAPRRSVVGIGVWSTGGRVSTLEMVGLNPQPEPPSRPALAVYTSGAAIVSIRVSCSRMPFRNTLVATGKGSDGRWYRLKVVDRGLPTGRSLDAVGVSSTLVPVNPCSEPRTITTLTAGDFLML